ncbi:GGDEF domain-containing protein [Rhodoferax saidenbachensis]|uniref:diguanylate cyclase n=1 Tax=Rhodoferax saidenbachensis TaxID=1484693 RepID=A0A1P8KE63_9BURK|nr:GGDEF domain-containing protein [Rhodoferax saidenbachensis]APW44320.1 GGDEF domain-containing protein [Rhodoferax saidenbachensis]
MSDAFSRLRAWFRAALLDSAHIQPEATAESIRRFRIFMTLGILANIAYLSYFWWLAPAAATPLQQRYGNTIGLIHAVNAAGLVVCWLCCHHLLRKAAMPPVQARLLQVLIAAWVMAFGISLSVADQWVGSNTTNYVMLSLIVAMLALLRPVAAALLFAVAYLALYHAMTLTQNDKAMLDMARSHSFTGTVMSLVASVVMWRQYVSAALLRRQLTESNASLEKKQEELSYLATHDALTGLRNRRAFLLEAEHELNRALRYPSETGILIADLDHFKRVNDRYGHPAGDAVLRHFADLLKAQLRDSDIAARLGGEEFIVLLPGTGTAGTAVVAEKIRRAIEAAPVAHADQHIAITVSIGVSSLPAHDNSAIDTLYGRADQALYAAKAEGRNRVVHAEAAPSHPASA